jgi:CubicO group peptidase (beta-lactamase class C family)
MKNILLLLIMSISSLFSFAQQPYKLSFEQLKEYQGVYEYANNYILKIAASPKDTVLYAIINQSQYALKANGRDIFMDPQNEVIKFLRNKSNAVTGYSKEGKTFKLLNRNIVFSKKMWYPRLTAYKGFAKPEDLKDGLPIGDIEKSGLDTALLSEMMRKITDGTYQNVHSVLIIKDGKLVFEEYFYDYGRDSLQELRSASKSFVSALMGITIGKGAIKNQYEKVLPFFPEYTFDHLSDEKKRITIENLLANQSGLDCDISNAQSVGNETKMDYSDDWVKFTLDLPMIDTPGGKGMYCSGNPVTVGRIIEKANKTPLPAFATENLFNPLGIKKFKWVFKPDKSNAEDYCQIYLSPRNMAKFGLMYLDNGVWNGKQIVPSDWVKQSFAKHSVVQGVDYGYLWWLKNLNANGVIYYGKLAQGNGGQKIYIWQEQNMVTVITGGNYNTQSPSNDLISKYILPAFNKK